MKRDCNKTEDFLREWSRMCKTEGICENCPFLGTDNVCNTLRTHETDTTIKNSIELVQKWSDEHPEVTMAEKFFNMFPNAKRDTDGLPMVCCLRLGWNGKSCNTSTCKECWNKPFKEVENEVE